MEWGHVHAQIDRLGVARACETLFFFVVCVKFIFLPNRDNEANRWVRKRNWGTIHFMHPQVQSNYVLLHILLERVAQRGDSR